MTPNEARALIADRLHHGYSPKHAARLPMAWFGWGRRRSLEFVLCVEADLRAGPLR